MARGSSFNWVLSKNPGNKSVAKSPFNIHSHHIAQKKFLQLTIQDGPGGEFDQNKLPQYLYTKSVSTYPIIQPPDKRDGDPICDHFRVKLGVNHVLLCLCDGCNW